MNFLKPKNLNSTNVNWLISEKTRLIVKNYAEYCERTESEFVDFFLTNVKYDEEFLKWVKKKRNNKRILTLLELDEDTTEAL